MPIEPYPVGTRGYTQIGADEDATFYPAVITSVRDYTDWCDTLHDDEPMYEADVTFPRETTSGLINHCRFLPDIEESSDAATVAKGTYVRGMVRLRFGDVLADVLDAKFAATRKKAE